MGWSEGWTAAKRPPEALPEVMEAKFGGKLGQAKGGPAPMGLVAQPEACSLKHAIWVTVGS